MIIPSTSHPLTIPIRKPPNTTHKPYYHHPIQSQPVHTTPMNYPSISHSMKIGSLISTQINQQHPPSLSCHPHSNTSTRKPIPPPDHSHTAYPCHNNHHCPSQHPAKSDPNPNQAPHLTMGEWLCDTTTTSKILHPSPVPVTPSQPGTAHLICHHTISHSALPKAEHTWQQFESIQTLLDYTCITHTNISQPSLNSRIISAPSPADTNQLCTISTPIHQMMQQLQQLLDH